MSDVGQPLCLVPSAASSPVGGKQLAREKTRVLYFDLLILNIQSYGKRRLSKFDGLVFIFKFAI